jgi:hypothetical protein
MKNRIFIVALGACLAAASLPAATHTVKVNADGSFSPPAPAIAGGDTVEWTLNGPGDSIIPINWDGVSSGFCSAIKAYSATDPNDLTGPLPVAASRGLSA